MSNLEKVEKDRRKAKRHDELLDEFIYRTLTGDNAQKQWDAWVEVDPKGFMSLAVNRSSKPAPINQDFQKTMGSLSDLLLNLYTVEDIAKLLKKAQEKIYFLEYEYQNLKEQHDLLRHKSRGK
jgi:hypothetical protein